VKEREVHGKRSRSLTRLFKPTHGKTEHKLQHAAQAQTAAVEELAMRADQVDLARLKKDQGTEALSALFAQASGAGGTLVRAALQRCAGVWGEAAEAIQGCASKMSAAAADGPGAAAKAAWGEARDTAPSLPRHRSGAGAPGEMDDPADAEVACHREAWGASVADSRGRVAAAARGTSGNVTELTTASASRGCAEAVRSGSPSGGSSPRDRHTASSRGGRGPQEAAVPGRSGGPAGGMCEASEAPPSARSSSSVGDSFVSGIVSDAASPVATDPSSPFTPTDRRLAGGAEAPGISIRSGDGIFMANAFKLDDEALRGSRGGYPMRHGEKRQVPLVRPDDATMHPAVGSASSRDCFVSEVVSPGFHKLP